MHSKILSCLGYSRDPIQRENMLMHVMQKELNMLACVERRRGPLMVDKYLRRGRDKEKQGEKERAATAEALSTFEEEAKPFLWGETQLSSSTESHR